MDLLALFFKTVLLRPYVFVFLAAFLFASTKLIGWPRTWRFWLISWATAFVCEFSSTRNGIPFGWYHYIRMVRRGRNSTSPTSPSWTRSRSVFFSTRPTA